MRSLSTCFCKFYVIQLCQPDEKDALMANKVIVNFRLPEEFVARLEALIPAVAADPDYATLGRVSTSLVYRVALLEGVKILEARYSKAKKRSQ
jgi:hypothetical protein